MSNKRSIILISTKRKYSIKNKIIKKRKIKKTIEIEKSSQLYKKKIVYKLVKQNAIIPIIWKRNKKLVRNHSSENN